ncbi:hypothetical protein [Chitinophaga arvensicola]|uniref:hypothetical protein n=1 Tax=Chitinophaga arvensicola TaxID=29529 RepID=UPI0015A69C9B|nr:hypothetical protein [Chitinophaga arvensicola]
MVFCNAFYSVYCNDVADAAEPVAGDAEVLAAWANPVAVAEPADVVNVPVLAALEAVVEQVAGVVLKGWQHLLSTSLKRSSESSSWHFFFVSN